MTRPERAPRIRAPWWLTPCIVPVLAAGILAGAGQKTAAAVSFVVGMAWLVVGGFVWAKQVERFRRQEGLGPREAVDIEWPAWERKIARGYVAVLAGLAGLTIITLVVAVVLLVIGK